MSGHRAGEFRHDADIPYKVKVIDNPSQEDLRGLSAYHVPHVYRSACDNLNRITRCKARMATASRETGTCGRMVRISGISSFMTALRVAPSLSRLNSLRRVNNSQRITPSEKMSVR